MIENVQFIIYNKTMIKKQRWDNIINLLNRKHSLSVKELAKYTKSSEATIRRDIVELDSLGMLEKQRGGVLKKNTYLNNELSVSEKHELNNKEKELIGKYAATLIKENDFVYIDAGTTTEALSTYINEANATYVTNSIVVALNLVRRRFKVILLGGQIKISTEALVGPKTIEDLAVYNFTIGFFGTNGINKENGFTTPDLNEALVKKEALYRCKKAYVLADESKFSLNSSIKFAEYKDAIIITNKIPYSKYKTDNVKEANKK